MLFNKNNLVITHWQIHSGKKTLKLGSFQHCLFFESRELIYKMLHRKHPKFDLMITSHKHVRGIQKTNVNPENAGIG